MGEIEKVFNLIFLDETKQENKIGNILMLNNKFQDFFEFPKLTLSEVREHEMSRSIWSYPLLFNMPFRVPKCNNCLTAYTELIVINYKRSSLQILSVCALPQDRKTHLNYNI